MSLGDRKHVEAVAIMTRMLEARMAGVDPDAWTAAEVWLRENHPEPEVYMAAVRDLAASASSPSSEGEGQG